MTIGERLRLLRHRAKMTLKDQSALLHVSINTIYRWERDICVPRKTMLSRLAECYNVSAEFLLYGDSMESETEHGDDIHPKDLGHQLLRMFEKLSVSSKYDVLKYVGLKCIEDVNKLTNSVLLQLGVNN